MQKVLDIVQILISTLISVAVLMQNRGAGLSAVFGGGGNIYRTKRGLEKGLFTLTIILVVLFVLAGVVSLVISS